MWEKPAYVLSLSLWTCRELVLVALRVPAAALHGSAAAEMELLWASDVLRSQRNSNSFFWAEDECIPLRVSGTCSFACRNRHSCSPHPFTAEDEEGPRQLWGHRLPLPCVDRYIHSHQWDTHTSGLWMLSIYGKKEPENIYFKCFLLGRKELLLSVHRSRTALFKGHFTQLNTTSGLLM